MQTQTNARPVMTDADFRIHWIAGFSLAAIAQTACCTPREVHARAERLGFITPINCTDSQGEAA